MTRFDDIRRTPTLIDHIPTGAKAMHESVLQAAQILYVVEEYLGRGVPGDVMLELITEMRGDRP